MSDSNFCSDQKKSTFAGDLLTMVSSGQVLSIAGVALARADRLAERAACLVDVFHGEADAGNFGRTE